MRESAAIYSTRFVSRRRMQQVGCEDSREGIVVLIINSMNALSNVFDLVFLTESVFKILYRKIVPFSSVYVASQRDSVPLRNFYSVLDLARSKDSPRCSRSRFDEPIVTFLETLSSLKIPNLRLITKASIKKNPSTPYRIRNGIEPRSIILPFMYLE